MIHTRRHEPPGLLAIACAASGELDRARAEGRKALTTARATQSATAARELRQLHDLLRS